MILEDVDEPELPPRSQLYCVPMLGTCGATQESMGDYVQRLAIMHGVRARHFIEGVVLPMARWTSSEIDFSTPAVTAFQNSNGAGRFAAAIGSAMVCLTGRDDILRGQLVRWQQLVGTRARTSNRRRWCAACLSTHEHGDYVAHALIWSLPYVKACPLHQVPLSDACGHCGKPQPFIADSLPFGKCKWCMAPLAAAKEPAQGAALSQYDVSVAECAADLVNASSQLSSVADSRLISERLKEVAATCSEGSVRRLVKVIGLPQSKSLTNKRTLSPEVFFDLMCRLGTKPSEFLGGTANCRINNEVILRPRVGKRSHIKFDELDSISARVDSLVDHALSDSSKRVSTTWLSAQVGLTKATFFRRFPSAAAKVVSFNREARLAEVEARWQLLREQVLHALQSQPESAHVSTSGRIQKIFKGLGIWNHSPRGKVLMNELVAARTGKGPPVRED